MNQTASRVAGPILVAIGSSPNSQFLVRWTHERAQELAIPWRAIYVDTGARLSPRERERLDQHLALARTLGARVEVIPGEEPAQTVLTEARERGASMIVVGRSGLSGGWPLARTATVSDRIVRAAGPIPVSVVQDSTVSVRPLRGRFRRPGELLSLLALAVGFLALTAFGALLMPLVTYRGLALIYLAAVLGLSFLAAPWQVAGFALASALALNFFFIPPRFTFSIASPEDWILFIVYFLVAFVTGGLVSRLRSRERLLAQRQQAMSFLLSAAEALASCTSLSEACAMAERLAGTHFGTPIGVLRPDRPVEPSRVEETETACLELALAQAREGKIGEAAASGGGRFRAIPALAGGRPEAVLVATLAPSAAWTAWDDDLLSSLGRILALVAERERLEETSRRASLELASQHLAKVLLDSVSHEMKTPLTTIMGSLSALRDDALLSRPEARRAIVEGALVASAAMNDIVEDLLSAGRIEAGALVLRRRRCFAAEIAEAALGGARPFVAGRGLRVLLPESPRPAYLDAPLVTRLLVNLLRNAGRYSTPGGDISLAVSESESGLSFTVKDAGPGLPPERLGSLFEKFRREEGHLTGGLGLGLAICRGIAEAHGGTISARNVDGAFEVQALFPDCFTSPVDGSRGTP